MSTQHDSARLDRSAGGPGGSPGRPPLPSQGRAVEDSSWRGERYTLLRYATLLYAFGLMVHTADHLHRGIDVLTPQVFWAGNISTLAGLGVIILVFAGHRAAPLAAAAFGLPTALGVTAVHLFPHWSAFSDAFPGAHHTGVTSASWAVVLVEILGATALSAAGILVLRRNRTPGREPVEV